MAIALSAPRATELKPRIVVFGVGGAGGNAVNNMIDAGLEGVEFVVANTDAQQLAFAKTDRRIQLADAASGPAFCAAAGVLQRAAFGPREAVPARALVNFGVRREPLDARTNPVIRAAVWLRDNL